MCFHSRIASGGSGRGFSPGETPGRKEIAGNIPGEIRRGERGENPERKETAGNIPGEIRRATIISTIFIFNFISHLEGSRLERPHLWELGSP